METQERKVWIDPRCTPFVTEQFGPFVALKNRAVLTIGQNQSLISHDGGKTWIKGTRMFRGRGTSKPCPGGLLRRTRKGVMVYVYMDMADYHWSWDQKKQEAGPDVRLDVWVIRSFDEGKTWRDRKRIFEGYCGALINMIETRSGTLVVPIQRLLRSPDRHALCVYVSADQGETWETSNIIDLGGHGHHDGAMEPTLVELKDGRIWMLIRTNLDQFWEAISTDQGRSWRVLRPSGIDASSAPGFILRLKSGRLALVWNRLYPKGRKRYPRRGGDGQLCVPMASWHREEVSIALSNDDGSSWSEPEVLIRVKGGGPSYPHIFEPAPGTLWVTCQFRDRLAVKLCEKDFVS